MHLKKTKPQIMQQKLLLSICLLLFSVVAVSQRTKVNFGSGWEFHREEPNANWEKVTLPHTVRLESLVVKKQFQGVSYYRKTFNVSPDLDKKRFFYFEGVMQEAEVSINGKLVMQHKGGYLPFTVNATDVVKSGDNQIEVKVTNTDNPEVPPGKPLKDLDFNYYGGIYRNVYLITTSKVYVTNAVQANKVASGGIFIKFNEVGQNAASGTIQVHLRNDSPSDKKVVAKLTLTDPKGKTTTFQSGEFRLAPSSDKEIIQNISIPNPQLWSTDHPNLYNAKIDIISEKKIIDSYTERTGIRKSEIRSDGYYLNGEKVFIAGTNRHQEYPYLGYAISDEAQYRDAVKIKNAGFDFVRLSHYPQAEAFLNACDELGILVMDCIPGWQFFGNEAFQQHSLQTIREMARRDRNHPSIIFWEASLNESNMSEDYMKKANEVLREELPGRDNITAGWMDNPNYDLYIPARQHGKAPDYWTKYNTPNRKIFIAEYGDWEYYAQNAGFSQKEFSNLKEEERTSRQLRAFGEKRLLQQAFNFQEASNSNRKGSATIGEANWLMFDYNRGYSPDLESSGISDIFRIPKFAYYYYQSQRGANIVLNKKLMSGPMIHIATYWTKDSPTNVTVYSNCDEVALYLNGTLIARQKPTSNAASDLLDHPPFIFNIGGFRPGTLSAEGFIKGQKVTADIVKTPGKPSQLKLEYDLSSKPISKDFPDVVFVYAKTTDESGTIIPDAATEVTFTLNGSDAQLIGENPIKAEAGVATILLRTTTFKKPLHIKASSTGLKAAEITLKP
jgi:beta-galactosidase